MKKTYRLDSLDLLRGIAALMVCFCHFGSALLYGNTYTSVFNIFYEYGRFGVQMFFVISGFVIPLSLYNSKFKISNYFTFILKRVVRLHIPYLFALAASLIIMFLSAYLKNRIVTESATTIFQSLFYNHIPANNGVFWTLIVEWQYYFFIGIFYCLLAKYPRLSVGIVMPVLLLISHMEWLSFNPSHLSRGGFFSFIVYFLIGNIGFLIYTKQGSILLNRLMLIGLVVFSFCFYQFAAAGVSLFTILFILFYKKGTPKCLLFFGKISYAVYLLHVPVGFKFLIIPFSKSHPEFVWTLFILALLMTIIVSYLFNKWVETTAEKFANKFKYKQKAFFIPGIISHGLSCLLQVISNVAGYRKIAGSYLNTFRFIPGLDSQTKEIG